MKIEMYCKCGGGCEGECDDRAEAKVREAWAQVHNGPDCAPCDKATAKAAEEKRDHPQMNTDVHR